MHGPAYLGGAPGGSWQSSNAYAGSFAGVQILPKELDEANALCLYGMASTHAGICPGFHVSGADGKTFRDANGVAFASMIPGIDEMIQVLHSCDTSTHALWHQCSEL
jgi:hypothetical protein